MMGCGCSIEIEHDAYATGFFREEWVKARKEHKCCECSRTILVGEIHEYVAGKWDHLVVQHRTCADCASVRDAFFCSYTYTTLWEDLWSHLMDGESLDWDCIALLTPRGREMVCDTIEEAWGEEEEVEDE